MTRLNFSHLRLLAVCLPVAASLLLVVSCKPTLPKPVIDPAPPALPTATPKIAVATPTPTPQPTPVRNLLPAGKYFVTERISVVTSNGVIGVEAGTTVVEIAPGEYKVGKSLAKIDAHKLTNDIDEMAAIQNEKAAIRKLRIQKRRDARNKAAQQEELAKSPAPAPHIPEPPAKRAEPLQDSIITPPAVEMTAQPSDQLAPATSPLAPPTPPSEKTVTKHYSGSSNVNYKVRVTGLDVAE